MSIINVEALKQNGCVLHWTGGPSSSNAPKQITPYGDVKQILPFPGAGIGMFDGTGDYLAIPDSDDWYFGTNDFTIEFFVNPKALPTRTVSLFEMRSTEYVSPIAIWLTNSTYSYKYSFVLSFSWNMTHLSTTIAQIGRWDHVALVRNGSNFVLYINGVAEHTYSSASSLANISDSLYIGGVPYATSSSLDGYLSEFRISKGIARYTSNFTVPKRQLESDSNTKLLIHFNRNDSTFIDSSPSAHTITAYGDAKQLCSPCGSGVAYFDGSGDYLTIPDNASLELGANNFTIEFWFNTLTYGPADQWGNKACIISRNQGMAEYGTWTIILDNGSGKIVGYCRDCTSTWTNISTSSYHNDGTWHHVAWVRNGTSWMLFIDGILESTSAYNVTVTDLNQPISIGKDLYFNRDYNGYLANFRISIGIARYTANFTPPTTPFKPDPYTKLLLHMDGQGNAFYDSSNPPGDNGFLILPDDVTITPNGTFAVQKMKDGRNIWKFDGSSNYITVSDHASWSMFLNDFTIAVWIKFDSVAANRTIIGQYTDANNQWYLQWTTSNVIQLYGITSSTARFNFSCPLTPVVETWYHVVVQRSGLSCVMYINGVAQTVTQTTAFSATATDIAAVLSIGNINTEYQAGNTKDLQIFTKALNQDQIAAIYRETFVY